MFNNCIGTFNGKFAIDNTGVYGNKEEIKVKEVSLKWDDVNYMKIDSNGSVFVNGGKMRWDSIKKDSNVKFLEDRISELEKEIKYLQMELKYNYLTKVDMDKIANYINKKNIEGLKRLSV